MKKTLSLILIVCLFVTVAVSQTLSIQGVLRDDTGASVANATKNLTFRLYTVETSGTAVWDETQTIEVVNGVYSATLGAVNSLAGLDYSVSYWLGISIDGAEEMTPRTKLTLSPYAIASVSGLDNVFPQSGDVGIGTASPTAQLSLGAWNSGSVGTTDGVQLRLSGTHNNGVNIGGTKLMIEGYDNDGAEVYPIYVQDENAAADFWIKNKPSGTGRSTAYFQGNVGIGKSTPKKQLTINSATNTAALSIGGYLSDGHWTGIQMGYGAEDADTYHKVGIFYKRVGGNALGSLIFATDNTSDDSNVDIDDARMTITSAGKVGIGTTSPARHLHVMLPNVANDANAYGIRLQLNNDDAGSDWWDIGIDNQAGDEDLIFKFSGGGYAWINPSDGAYGHSSDMRLKKNIEPMGNVLDKVMQLKPSTYHMKSEADTDQKKIGFIAQDVQKVFPDVNTVSEQNGMLGLSYDDFSVLAIAAIQEQQKIITQQQKEIDELKERMDRLEALVRKQ
jgi:trimeric autotransporter adhesin